jgi:hypothetical protein
VTLSVTATGAGPLAYQWQYNGATIVDCVPPGVPNTNFIITTVAGNGTNGFSGDGGPATNAELCVPGSPMADEYGNLYIADCGNNRVRKVAPDGIICTVAGNGGYGSWYTGILATNSVVASPRWALVDGCGNLFISISEQGGPCCIAKVGTNGIMNVVVGSPGGYFGGDGGPAINAHLNVPDGICFDAAGNLYIADSDNNRVRKVGTNGIITTVAGTNDRGRDEGLNLAPPSKPDRPISGIRLSGRWSREMG